MRDYIKTIEVPKKFGYFIGFHDDPVSAGIAAGGSVVSSVINGLFAERQNAKQRNFAREMYAQQMRDTIAQWNRENEYNTPANQKQRLIDAGLNPNLMMDNGDVGNAQSASMPNASGSYTPVQAHFENPFNSYVSAALAQSQIDKTNAETAKIGNDIQIDTAMLEANLKQMGVDLDTAKQNYWYNSQFLPKELQAKDLAIKSATLQLDLVELQKDSQNIINELNREDLRRKRAFNSTVDEEAALNIARQRQELRNMVLQEKVSLASAADMYASAAAHYAGANLSKAQQNAVEYDTQFKRENKVFFLGNLAQDFLNSSQVNEKQKHEIEVWAEEAKQKKFQTDRQEVDKWIERGTKILGSVVGAIGVGAGAFFGLKRLGSTPSGTFDLNGYTPSASDVQYYSNESPYDRLKRRVGKK